MPMQKNILKIVSIIYNIAKIKIMLALYPYSVYNEESTKRFALRAAKTNFLSCQKRTGLNIQKSFNPALYVWAVEPLTIRGHAVSPTSHATLQSYIHAASIHHLYYKRCPLQGFVLCIPAFLPTYPRTEAHTGVP